MLAGKGFTDRQMTEPEALEVMREALAQVDLTDKRVLVIIPDRTRSGPTGQFFHWINGLLGDDVEKLDFLIALGTHQPLSEEDVHEHLGVTAEEMEDEYRDVDVFNHAWDDPDTFVTIGVIPEEEIERLSNGLLSVEVPVRLNKMLFEYDQVIVCGPVFPHEVVGMSGGNKYFFPGVSGQEVIDVTHWLGALITSYEIIGRKKTPVRDVINRAASFIDVPKLCFAYVVEEGGLTGLYIGAMEEAWSQAVDLSSELHIRTVEHPYRKVLSVMPEMYDDIWTAAKGMYKLEPVVEEGGEVIIYAPHITEISYTHGDILDEIGYHIRDYFVEQWEEFKDYPWGVLAHSTHLRGMGTYEDGVEKPRIDVTLATGIPRERCERVNLGYRDPDTIDPEEWKEREDEGILLVPHAGEMLYRLEESSSD